MHFDQLAISLISFKSQCCLVLQHCKLFIIIHLESTIHLVIPLIGSFVFVCARRAVEVTDASILLSNWPMQTTLLSACGLKLGDLRFAQCLITATLIAQICCVCLQVSVRRLCLTDCLPKVRCLPIITEDADDWAR